MPHRAAVANDSTGDVSRILHTRDARDLVALERGDRELLDALRGFVDRENGAPFKCLDGSWDAAQSRLRVCGGRSAYGGWGALRGLLPVGITTKLAALMAVAAPAVTDTAEPGRWLRLEGRSR
jgi:hypothetical protein